MESHEPCPQPPWPCRWWPGRGRAALGPDGPRTPPSPSLSSLFQADVRDEEALVCAFEGVDCVFHMASHGMSGAEKVGSGDSLFTGSPLTV